MISQRAGSRSWSGGFQWLLPQPVAKASVSGALDGDTALLEGCPAWIQVYGIEEKSSFSAYSLLFLVVLRHVVLTSLELFIYTRLALKM